MTRIHTASLILLLAAWAAGFGGGAPSPQAASSKIKLAV